MSLLQRVCPPRHRCHRRQPSERLRLVPEISPRPIATALDRAFSGRRYHRPGCRRTLPPRLILAPQPASAGVFCCLPPGGALSESVLKPHARPDRAPCSRANVFRSERETPSSPLENSPAPLPAVSA